MTASVRPARPEDAAAIRALVRELAEYEKLLDQVQVSEAQLGEALFGDHPRVFCEIAEHEGKAVGMALWFYNFSTFLGRHGIWLEDLFVKPEARGQGLGKALIAALAERCVREGLGRLEWWVLDWNEPSIRFYRSLGAEAQDEWTVYRLAGDALHRLGGRPA